MRTRTKAVLVGAAALTAIGVVAPAPAGAVTGGTPTGESYGNVGLILFYDAAGDRYRCSATLVSPTVLLTAAHCTDGTVGETIVTFEPDVAEAPPSGIPVADDPSAGYQVASTFTDTRDRTWYSGTAHTHPQYSGFTDLANWNDVGVVVLDEAPAGITPAQVAPENYLDQFAQPRLNHETFTLVGYGTEVRKPEEGPRKPTPETYPLIRRVTEVVGQKLTPQILQVNGNPNDTRGGGGSCFGDSGGPTFEDGYVITVTSYGYTANCRYLDGLQRVDIPVVQDWLATFGVQPAQA